MRTARRTALGLSLFVVACSPPTVFDVRSSLEPRSAQSCVVHALMDHGFRITDHNRRDGFVRGEKPARFLGFHTDDSHVIEVFVLDEGYGETTIQYMAGRLDYGEYEVDIEGPNDETEATAREIAHRCSG